ASTPAQGGDPFDYASPIEHVLAFHTTLTRGEHELTVRYAARPTALHRDTLVKMQLAYLLAPARDWGGFGKLHVEVNAPEGWQLHADPALTRNGAVWSQHFDGI